MAEISPSRIQPLPSGQEKSADDSRPRKHEKHPAPQPSAAEPPPIDIDAEPNHHLDERA